LKAPSLWIGFLLICAALNLFVPSAFGQGSCMQSFNVKDRPLLTYDWLPGNPGQSMSCMAAERLREKIYIDNKDLFDNAADGDPATYISTAKDAIASAQAKIDDLNAAIQRNDTEAGLMLSLEVVLYEIGKAGFMVSCLAPDVTVTKLFCGATFLGIGIQSMRIINGNIAINEFSQLADKNRQLLQQTQSNLDSMKAKLNASNFSQVKKNNVAMFNGLCAAIKSDCL
jgi:hypothetical protein